MNDVDLDVKETSPGRLHHLPLRLLSSLMLATLIAPIFFWLALIVQMITSR